MRSEGRAVSTCNIVVRKILSLPFEKARILGYIPINPTKAVDPLTDKAEAREAEREPFTLEEVSQLIELASDEWQGVIIVAATTGLRLGDCVTIKWSNIHDDFIKLTTQKTHDTVEVPIHADFAEFLSSQTRGIGNAPIFPDLSKRRVNGSTGLSRQFRKLMTKVKVIEKVVNAKGAAGLIRFSKGFHSFRHYFISTLATAGVSQEISQKLTARSGEKDHKFYTHLKQ